MLLLPDADLEVDPWGPRDGAGPLRPPLPTPSRPAPGVLEVLLAVLAD